MMNPLDMLVIVFMAMSVASLLAVCLVFLMKKDLPKKIAFYFLTAQGMLISWMNALMTPSTYPGELAIGWALGGLSVAALIWQICGKNENRFRYTRIIAAVSVILGMLNAFVY